VVVGYIGFEGGIYRIPGYPAIQGWEIGRAVGWCSLRAGVFGIV
jgi:hypothetical protein